MLLRKVVTTKTNRWSRTTVAFFFWFGLLLKFRKWNKSYACTFSQDLMLLLRVPCSLPWVIRTNVKLHEHKYLQLRDCSSSPEHPLCLGRLATRPSSKTNDTAVTPDTVVLTKIQTQLRLCSTFVSTRTRNRQVHWVANPTFTLSKLIRRRLSPPPLYGFSVKIHG